MSDYPQNPARPVSLFTIGFLLVLFAAFLLVVRKTYSPAEIAPQNAAAEKLPDDQKWRATAESRHATLREARENETKALTHYGWANKDTKAVRLPIDQAIKLTAQDYSAKK